MNQGQPLPYGRPSISEADIAAVVDVLRSDWLTQGPAVPAFEDAVAKYCHSRHAIAVHSATGALHRAGLALQVGPGDWVWTSPNSFVAGANCALYCGAQVDFVDIDPRTLNLCPIQLASKLAQAQQSGRLPKVVIAVHFAGQSCDMQAIAALPRQYGFRIIEDASHAVGASVRYKAVHTQPLYQSLGFESGGFPVAEEYARETLSLPMYPALTDEAQERVAQALRKVLRP